MHATPGDMKSFRSSAESMALMTSVLRRSGDQAGGMVRTASKKVKKKPQRTKSKTIV